MRNGEFYEIGALKWIVQGLIYICFETSFVFFFFFFTAGFILHSQSFIRKVRGFHEFCESFFRRKTADCQKLRGEIKSPQSFPGFTSRLIHLFCKSSRDLLKISCFGELHSPEICRVSRFNIEVAEFLRIIPLFSSSFDLSKWIFFTLNFFVALPWNLSRCTLCCFFARIKSRFLI